MVAVAGFVGLGGFWIGLVGVDCVCLGIWVCWRWIASMLLRLIRGFGGLVGG